MKNNNRRDFLKTSILGVSGAILVPSAIKASPVNMPSASAPQLPVRTLGKTGIKTPLISMGTGNSTSPGFIRSAYEAGVKVFFSATYYGEGNNEKLVGEGLKGISRDSYVVGTAVPPDGLDNRTGLFIKPFDPKAYLAKAELSLKRFGIEQVDFLLLPYAGKKEMVLNEGVLKALQQLKQQGKTKYVGIASHSDTEEALNAAVSSGVYDVAMIGYNFKSLNIESFDKTIAKAHEAGMGIVAMKTTSGAFRNKSGPAINSDAALKWVLRNENISSIVSGMSSLEELQKNIAMLQNTDMTDQEMKDLQTSSLENEPGLYCRQCGNCIYQCPKGVDVPSLMRSYMYAYGYKDVSKAWHTVNASGLKGDPCAGCSSCSVDCTSRFDIKERIADISRLQNIPGDFILA